MRFLYRDSFSRSNLRFGKSEKGAIQESMMRIGIVGLPNVGKSTLFSALTKRAVGISNYPFTTVDPNVGVVSVPDVRLQKIAAMSKSARIVPTTVEFIDIAGLVKGANRGEGLGNQFLAHIREVDAIVEVVRAFESPEITHVEGAPDPARDHVIVETELILKDLETVEKAYTGIEKEAKLGKKEAAEQFAGLVPLRVALREGKATREVFGNAPEVVGETHRLSLLTAKPTLIFVNASDAQKGEGVAAYFRKLGLRVFVGNIRDELEGGELNAAERQELGLSESALDQLVREAYDILSLVTFFTVVGGKEAHAWTVRQGTLLPQAAGVVHSGFEKKFIRADVINWKTLVDCGDWAEARAKGLIRSEGKAYVIRDGDVVEVKHNQ